VNIRARRAVAAGFRGCFGLRMRRIPGKMTTFDDFLTTNDDFRRWSLPGRNGFSEAVLFYFKGLSIVAATKRRVIDCSVNSTA
jgi:hypothetical protein